MKSVRQLAAGVRRRAKVLLMKRRFPVVVTIKKFERSGVRFEINNATEVFRVDSHGGETDYLAAMLCDLRKDDVLYDVGANVGMVALHAASICQTVAFEPEPAFRRRLEVNASLNPDRSFSLEPIAISDSDGSVDLYTDGEEGTSPSLVHQRGESGMVSVPARSLDSLLNEGRLPPPTVIKLDIEGAEILALRGARQLLTEPGKPRALFIEIHDTFLPGFGSSADEVDALLNEFGYTNAIYRERRGSQRLLILHSS
jgi:FkbM family methyltransferase